ncbi:MAG: SET domain-containing protein-lysine N-methyltransferase [Gammaproteobacteria bacterium]|nr:SET domain-containing protein-lysine N-methyltransferase [Gammaproteobacteria bacterium]
MKAKLFQNAIVVKPSPLHGYGVFAEKDISKGDIVEECYTLVSLNRESDFLNYYFNAAGKNGFALGYGGIYNHSDDPSISFEYDADNQIIIYKARRAISKGEELFISYGKSWFDSRNLQPTKTSWIKKIYHRYFNIGFRLLVVFNAYLFIFLLLKYLSK